MFLENIVKWKKKYKILKPLWNILYKTMEPIVSVVKYILLIKIQVSEKLNKIDWCSYEILLHVARKKRLL